MSKKNRGLGKGIAALMKDSSPAADVASAMSENGDLKHLAIDLIQRGQYQPRKDMRQDALEELAASIRAQGVMQPIVVRPTGTGSYEIIAGERRWRASQLAGLHQIPAVIREVSDEDTLAMALIENIQRENLNPMEEAMAMQRLMKEFELTQQALADAVGKNRATVANLLRLNGLTQEVKTLLEHGDIEMGHARALLALETDQQIQVARQVVNKGLTVRQTEALVRQAQQPVSEKKPAPEADANISSLEEMLAKRLGAQVGIQHGPKGKGKLVIQYNSLDELDGILGHIK